MQEYIEFFQQNMMLSLMWIGLVVAIIVSFVSSATAKYKEIDANKLTHLINRENGVVIDIRSDDEYKKGHITDALHILPSQITNGSLSAIAKYKSTPIIVVCKAGYSAKASAKLLVKAGFQNVNVLRNGLTAWQEASLPLVNFKNTKSK